MKKITKKIMVAGSLALGLVALNSNANGYSNNNGDYWSGAYLGAYIGGGEAHFNQHFNSSTDVTDTTLESGVPSETITTTIVESGNLKGNSDGSVTDLFMGYNFHPRCSKFVFGLQVEGTLFSDIILKATGLGNSSHQVVDSFAVETPFIEDEIESVTTEFHDELRSAVTLLARAGYLVNPCLLAYGLAGPTDGHFVIPDSFDIAGGKRSKWELGYTAGVGLEYRFNAKWSARAEYRYIHIDIDRNASEIDNTFTADSIGETEPVTSITTVHRHTNFGFNEGTLSIVYRFDTPCCS